MRSRVTAKLWPTSSSVCSLPSPTPNRILITFSSRGVSVFSTDSVCSLRFRLITASAGDTTCRSSMKSPRCESSSSPIGVSSEIGSCAILDLADLRHRDVHPLGDLFGGRFAAELLHERARRTNQLVDGLDHVDRDTDRPRLVGDCTGDRLADPPRRVGRELVAAAVLELVDRLHQ